MHAINLRMRFHIDPSLDIKGYEMIKEFFPLLCPTFPLPEHVTERVFSVHKQDAATLEERVAVVEKEWNSKKEKFAHLASTLFSANDFPEDEYVCYPTIWSLIARDPESHSIAFPYNSSNEEACYVIAHELLHELFFHHIHNKFEGVFDLNSPALWDLSEVVNVLILRSQEWQEVFPFRVEPYPQHRGLLQRLEPLWNSHQDIDALIREI